MPAGPPPTTTRSDDAATGTRPEGSVTNPGVAVMGRSFSGVVRHVPAQHASLDERDHAEEQCREGRADDDGGVEQRRIEIVGRLDDQRADTLGRADHSPTMAPITAVEAAILSAENR